MPRADAPSATRVALETIELHLPQNDGAESFDLSLSLVRPRRGHGQPYFDIGLLHEKDGEIFARAARAPLTAQLDLKLLSTAPTWQRHWHAGEAQASLDLSIGVCAQRGTVALIKATGTLRAFDREIRLADSVVIVNERRAARRPYAWARATLFGRVENELLICVIETSRGRAGSVVLPALGRMRLYGPGARHLPKGCVLSPLPARAEYGTGRLRAAALAPSHRIEIELDAPVDSTALFEVVDPNGDAAYAHRALGASATLRLRDRKKHVIEISLAGRYEWGARAGDPRVEHRAWRS